MSEREQGYWEKWFLPSICARIFHVALATLAFDSRSEDSNWNQAVDLDDDNGVYIFDMVLPVNKFGKTGWMILS